MPDTAPRPLANLRWQYLHLRSRGSVPQDWRPWLEDRGSLTRRLRVASEGDFAVRVLRQAFGLPLPSEAGALALGPRRWALIREVVLSGRGVPWVYARSVLPLDTLSGRLRRLRQLDDRPLGQVLFSDNSMRRDPVQIARLPGAALPAGVCPGDAGPALLWGRRSVFRVDDKPLLVAEFFLPGFEPYNAGR